MPHSELTFIRRTLNKARKLGFEKSVAALTSLLRSSEPINTEPVARLETAGHTARRAGRTGTSRSLKDYKFASSETDLVAALATRGIVTRVDLINALVENGRKRNSMDVDLARLLAQESLSADISRATDNTAKAIYRVAGLPLPAIQQPTKRVITETFSRQPVAHPAVPALDATKIRSVTSPTAGMRTGLKSRLLSSFPFAYRAQRLIDALAARDIHTRSDLLRIMKKRKLETGGVSQFLDGQLTTNRGAMEGYSVTAQTIAGIARLPSHDAYGLKQQIGPGRPASLLAKAGHNLATEIAGVLPDGIRDGQHFVSCPLDRLAPGLTQALAKAGLNNEARLRDELVRAGVSKGKAAIAVDNFLEGSLLGTIRHQAGSTSIGRFFCDRAGVSFAGTLVEISKPAPARPTVGNGQDMGCAKACPDAEPTIPRSPEEVVRSTATKTPAIDPFDQGLLVAMPKLMRQALTLTRNKASSEDLIQHTLVQALAAQRERQGFQPAPDEAYQQSLEKWLYTIQRNAFISGLRKTMKHQHVSLTAEDGEADILNYLPVAQRQEGIIEVQDLLERVKDLPREQRDALVQIAFHGDSYEKLAEATGVAVGTAKSRVFRARNALGADLDRPRNHSKTHGLNP